MKKLNTLSLFVALLILTFCMPAFATQFVSIPGKVKNLELRIVEYDGGTNGAMVVEVKNSGSKIATFAALGLFFVPLQTANKAPQRLGASGPFTEQVEKTQRVHTGDLKLAAGETKRLRLEVFCIDSHRASPTNETQFSLAKKRLPKSLTADMKKSNAKIYKASKGSPKKFRGRIQKNMWEQRNKKWIKVEGEGKQESELKNGTERKQRHQRNRR